MLARETSADRNLNPCINSTVVSTAFKLESETCVFLITTCQTCRSSFYRKVTKVVCACVLGWQTDVIMNDVSVMF